MGHFRKIINTLWKLSSRLQQGAVQWKSHPKWHLKKKTRNGVTKTTLSLLKSAKKHWYESFIFLYLIRFLVCSAKRTTPKAGGSDLQLCLSILYIRYVYCNRPKSRFRLCYVHISSSSSSSTTMILGFEPRVVCWFAVLYFFRILARTEHKF